RDQDAHLSRQLLVALTEIDENKAVLPLISALHSAIPEVRAAAAELLGPTSDPVAQAALADVLQDEADDRVRQAIEEARPFE
ncbi:MAG: HEAT repeat domain-containing protein, partial [Actinobacteria bacterium]